MSALPERVRQQAELANQLSGKIKAGTLTIDDMRGAPAAPAAQQPMPTGFQPQPAGDGTPGLNSGKFNPQPAAAPATAANVAGQPAPAAPAPDEAAAEHRFKVLQGKYNAEVPRLHKATQEQERQIRALQDQLNATQNLLATLGSSQATAPHLSAPPAPPQLVSPKEVTEFGADLYDFVKRAAQEVVAPQVHSLEERFRPVAQTVQQMAPMVQQTAENQQQLAVETTQEKIWAGLDGSVPNWEKINESPEFRAWLDDVDPYAGAKRGAMLAQAYGNGDVTRVVNFFTGFTKEHAAVAPTGGNTAAPAPQGTPPAGKPNVDLASLAAPGTGVGGPSTAGTPNESGQQRVYTQAEIGAFYRDVQKGAYKGREADKAAIERDIFNAQKSGRVRP